MKRPNISLLSSFQKYSLSLFFPDLCLWVGCNLEKKTPHNTFYQDQFQRLLLHLEEWLLRKQPKASESHDHCTENFSKSKKKFESNLYTTEMTNAGTLTSWFYNLFFPSQNKTDSKLPLGLKITVLLDNVVSISIINTAGNSWSLKYSLFVIVVNTIHEKHWLLQIS